jgi:hypothetical protein
MLFPRQRVLPDRSSYRRPDSSRLAASFGNHEIPEVRASHGLPVISVETSTATVRPRRASGSCTSSFTKVPTGADPRSTYSRWWTAQPASMRPSSPCQVGRYRSAVSVSQKAKRLRFGDEVMRRVMRILHAVAVEAEKPWFRGHCAYRRREAARPTSRSGGIYSSQLAMRLCPCVSRRRPTASNICRRLAS